MPKKPNTTILYTFVAAISYPKKYTDNWQLWFSHQLADSKFSMATDDSLLHENEIIGFYRLIDPEEANTLFGSQEWFSLAQECPWFHGLIGFFNWTHVADQAIAEEHLLPKLIQTGSTVIARTDSQQFKLPVRLVEFSLANLLSKHGFEDGDAFLSREEEYLMYVYDKLTRAMEEAGLEGHIALLETAHNPLQLSQDLIRDGKPVSDERLVLSELSVQFWAYDWDILRDCMFWQD